MYNLYFFYIDQFLGDHQTTNGNLSSSSLTHGSPARPSSKQIWDRINGRMLELHPELASMSRDSQRLGGSSTDLTHHLHPLNNTPAASNAGDGRSRGSLSQTVKTESGQEFLVLFHDPSSSLLSVRLPPIHDNRISSAGRMALKKLREEIHFK